jgi:GT2 family glycosyltransferase
MSAPRISVLVATADRPGLLAGCLESLAASTFRDAEVLVLDQSLELHDPPPDLPGAGGMEMIRIRCPRQGKSAALNAGIARARGEMLAFTDDDCRVAPDWLETIHRAESEPGRRFPLTGMVLAGESEGDAAVAPSLREDATEKTYRKPVCRDVLFGNNMALPREVFRRVGPFDEALGPGTPAPAAEDNDLGYRILRAGIPIRYLPEMRVIHRSWRGEKEQVDLFRRYGVGQGAFYGKHARRGDFHMLARMALSLWDAGRDAGGAAVLRRGYDIRTSSAFASGLMRGFLRSAFHPSGDGGRAMPAEGR